MSELILNEMNGNEFKEVFNNKLLNTEDSSQDVLGPLFINEGVFNEIEIGNISMNKTKGYIKMIAEFNELKIKNHLSVGTTNVINIKNKIIDNIKQIEFGNLIFNNNWFTNSKDTTQFLYAGNIQIDTEGFSSKSWGYGNEKDSNVLNTNALVLTAFGNSKDDYSVLYIKPPYNNKGQLQDIKKAIRLDRKEKNGDIKQYYINGVHNNDFNHEVLYILYDENTKGYKDAIGSKGVCFLGVQNKNADFNGIWIRSCNINGGEYSAEKYSSLYVNSPNNKDGKKRELVKDIINIDTGNKAYNLYGEHNMKEVFLEIKANQEKNDYSLDELGVNFYPNVIIAKRYFSNNSNQAAGFFWTNKVEKGESNYFVSYNKSNNNSQYEISENSDLKNFLLKNLSQSTPSSVDKYYHISFYYI